MHAVDHAVTDHTAAMPFDLRDAGLSDMQELQGVFRRASLSNHHDRDPLLRHPGWLVLSENGVREGRMRVAVDQSGAVVGFTTYVIADGVAGLEDLFVDPQWMRRGVGKALVLDISAQVGELKFDTLEVTANPHAQVVYEHMGFVAVQMVDTEFYRALRMRRPT